MDRGATSGQRWGEPSTVAKPLKLQKLEQYLNLNPYLNFLENEFASDVDSSLDATEEKITNQFGPNEIYTSKEEVRSDRSHFYNLSCIGPDRKWLEDVLLSDTDDDSDSSEGVGEQEKALLDDRRIKEMLKEHVAKKKYKMKFAKNPRLRQYRFYGTGLLSTIDRFPAHQEKVLNEIRLLERAAPSDSKKRKKQGEGTGSKKVKKEVTTCETNDEVDGWMDRDESGGFSPLGGLKIASGSKSKRKNSVANTVEAMNARRRKLWIHIAKKEVGKTQRARSSNHKEVLTSCKRTAQLCMRVNRHKAIQSQKTMKDCVWRMKRMTREMQSFWKRYDRVERETKRRMEKDAEEQRKYDAEFREVKRQQRKLNFLITQTELYAHFMQGKLASCSSQPDELARILGHLDEPDLPTKFADEYDSAAMKAKAQENVTQALTLDQARVQEFPFVDPNFGVEQEQPEMFEGVLKHYQIKGVSWLANLYDQGINGILADEMGLGKTVQSIAFLCHIAEKYSIWGPFLVISPASTLHNWQQEFAKFVPPFKVIPYWGTPHERRILRQFWAQKNVHTEEASFHVVITSYQLVVADIKYFNRVKWQYLVLDEAQAIKSSSSVRWKSLLGFQCRNRLLLSGTPVQNSMAELWALLHFIMPTLFDNHEEFAEWFSKDIESHAENKGSIDEKHLSRLHMILKPFMLRRIKKDVENELSDKIELMVYCPLTTRQKLLYSALKKKIRIEDLLHSSSSGTQSSVTSSLMNLVMQFRKVCNHPELFERQDPRVPYHCRPIDEDLPCLVFNESLVPEFNPESHHSALKQFCIFSPENVHLSCIGKESYRTFSFARLLNLSPCDIASIYLQGAEKLWSLLGCDSCELGSKQFNMQIPRLSFESQDGLPNLIFTKFSKSHTYGFGTVNIHSMPETLEHRILRSSKIIHIKSEVEHPMPHASTSQPQVVKSSQSVKTQRRVLLPEFQHEPKATQVLECQPLDIPKFLTHVSVRVDSRSRKLYCYSRRAANTFTSVQTQVSKVLSTRIAPFKEHVPWGSSPEKGGLEGITPSHGWCNVLIPDKQSLISDAGKLSILDGMLHRLKSQGHRVLVYSQMTKMIDLLEEFMYYRKHTYMRLDGSSKISERRDMVADFQNREDIFVFLLSTRAGGLGINLTAADTVIFYDSDWNPTVDQQAMDRAHRLGQTKQVTVYRLICKDTIEERILQRAQEKSEIQRMVISGGSFKPDTLKPTEVVSLLLDDAEIEHKYRQKQAERRGQEEKKPQSKPETPKLEDDGSNLMAPTSPSVDEDSDGTLIVDVEGIQPSFSAQTQTSGHRPFLPTSSRILSAVRGLTSQRGGHGRSRGRPRGSRGKSRGSSRPAHGNPIIGSDGNIICLSESLEISSPGIRRGPGRPRLKPYGPGHQGGRRNKKSIESNPNSPCSSPLVIAGSSSSREVKEREFKSFDLFLQ